MAQAVESTQIAPPPAGSPDDAPSGVDLYDLAIWCEDRPISADQARRSYLALAAGQLDARRPAVVQGFVDALLACFPGVVPDALPAVPGCRNARIPAINGECFAFDAGVFVSFPSELAPDLTPLVTHLADLHGVVVYDRQRQGVFLPASVEVEPGLRITAGDGFVVAHAPTAAEIPPLLDAADASSWFRIIERDPDHFLQAVPAEPDPTGETERRWIVEYRDGDGDRDDMGASGGGLFRAEAADLEQVKQAFVLYAVGGTRWRDLFAWTPLRPTTP